jgi:hypothetical protein
MHLWQRSARLLILLTLMQVSAGQGHGDTILPPVITADLTLDPAGSPYIAQEMIQVQSGATLTADPGVEIRFEPEAGLMIQGVALFHGTAAEPINLRPVIPGEEWANLNLYYGSGLSEFHHVDIEGASTGPDYWMTAAISIMRTPAVIDNLTLNLCGAGIFAYDTDTTIADSRFGPDNGGEAINTRRGTTVIENCHFQGGGEGVDSIDLDTMTEAVIRNCVILDSPDECIDMGESVALVEGCFISGCVDKGITVGEGSTATIRFNLIRDCPVGIGVSESSTATVDHCTLYGNGVGIRVEERTPDQGGGAAEITNTIISESLSHPLTVEAGSSAQVSFSLSDTEPLAGTGNLLGDPLFNGPISDDFTLDPASPCIDTGDPTAPLDSDGTTTDMGAFPFNHFSSTPPSVRVRMAHLRNAFPNPFNPATRLTFNLPHECHVKLEIFDIHGRRVSQLADGDLPAGDHGLTWRAEGHPSGLYLARLQAGRALSSIRLLLLK